MAQTEMMLRLLKNRKIVGYEQHKDGRISHSENIEGWCNILIQVPRYNDEKPAYIDHDSFELGLKVKSEWWFEGDIIRVHKHIHYGYIGILTFCEHEWEIYKPNHDNRDTLIELLYDNIGYDNIGNIHNNPILTGT